MDGDVQSPNLNVDCPDQPPRCNGYYPVKSASLSQSCTYTEKKMSHIPQRTSASLKSSVAVVQRFGAAVFLNSNEAEPFQYVCVSRVIRRWMIPTLF